MKTAIIYARQSSGDTEKSESIDLQLIHCRARAMELGYKSVKEFTDYNSSCETYPSTPEALELKRLDRAFQNWEREKRDKTTSSDRDGLAGVIGEIQSGHVDSVIVEDITRLYRPLKGSHLEPYLVSIFTEHNIHIVQIKGGEIDLHRNESYLVNAITGITGMDTLKKYLQRAIEGIRKLRYDGIRPNASRQYGYQKVLGDRHALQIVPEEAIWIKKMFEMYVGGYSLRDISIAIEPHVHRSFSTSAVKQLLVKPIYAGKMVNPDGELIPCKTVPPIISEELWLKACAMQSTLPPMHHRKYCHALSGLLKCGNCGRPIYIQTSMGGYIYGICSSQSYKSLSKECRACRVRYDAGQKSPVVNPAGQHMEDENGNENVVFDTAVASQPLMIPAERPAGLEESIAGLLAMEIGRAKMESAEARRLDGEIISTQNEIETLEGRVRRLYLLLDNADPTIIQTAAKELSEGLRCARERLSGLQQQKAMSSGSDLLVTLAAMQIDRSMIDPHQYKMLANRLFRSIRVFKSRVEVEFSEGGTLKLARILKGRGACMPLWTLRLDGEKPVCIYLYPSAYRGDKQTRVLYESNTIRVEAMGR